MTTEKNVQTKEKNSFFINQQKLQRYVGGEMQKISVQNVVTTIFAIMGSKKITKKKTRFSDRLSARHVDFQRLLYRGKNFENRFQKKICHFTAYFVTSSGCIKSGSYCSVLTHRLIRSLSYPILITFKKDYR